MGNQRSQKSIDWLPMVTQQGHGRCAILKPICGHSTLVAVWMKRSHICWCSVWILGSQLEALFGGGFWGAAMREEACHCWWTVRSHCLATLIVSALYSWWRCDRSASCSCCCALLPRWTQPSGTAKQRNSLLYVALVTVSYSNRRITNTTTHVLLSIID